MDPMLRADPTQSAGAQRLANAEAFMRELHVVTSDLNRRLSYVEDYLAHEDRGGKGRLNSEDSEVSKRQRYRGLMLIDPASEDSSDSDDDIRKEEGYALEGSAWDAAICLGHPRIGQGGSILIFVLVVMNAGLQIMFTSVVGSSFTEDPYSTEKVDALRSWRLGVAHAASQVNMESGTSLASRVCEFDESLVNSFLQRETAEDLDEYGLNMFRAGPVMCMLSLGYWVMIGSAEFARIFRFTLALWYVPHGSKTTLREDAMGMTNITSLSWMTFVFCNFVNIVRALTALCLLWFGSRYLVRMENVKDLLIDVVALQFIFEVDEQLFSAFAPARARAIFANIQPLPLPKPPHWAGADNRSLGMLATLTVFLTLAFSFSLIPEMASRREAFDNLCGGNKQFAVATDGLGRLHWSRTRDFAGEFDNSGYFRRTVELITEQEDSAEVQARAMYNPVLDDLLDDVQKQSVKDAGKRLPCANADAEGGSWSRMGIHILQEATGNSSVKHCADVVEYCRSGGVDGIRARQWCPMACGCGSVASGLLLDGVSMGCPESCQQEYLALTQNVACEEPTAEESLRAPNFTNYTLGAKMLFASHGYKAPSLVRLLGQMAQEGCAALKDGNKSAYDLCMGVVELPIGKVEFRSIHPLCPVSCGCNSKADELTGGYDGNRRPSRKELADALPLVLTGACEEQAGLDGAIFYPKGAAASGHMVYRTSSGLYLYPGPSCDVGTFPDRWVISPVPCGTGYMIAFTFVADASPPESAKWQVYCAEKGWETPIVSLLPRPAGGRLKVKDGLCLEAPGHERGGEEPLHMWPCESISHNTAEWVYNSTTAQLRKKRGYCLDGAADTNGVRAAVVGLSSCEEGDENQRWNYNATSGLIKNERNMCLDASQPASIGSSVHLYPCRDDNPRQKWSMIEPA